VLYWFPFYFLFKLVFLVWCMWPSPKNGSAVIYNQVNRRITRTHTHAHTHTHTHTQTKYENCAHLSPFSFSFFLPSQVLKKYLPRTNQPAPVAIPVKTD
jgi:hypothetical protein